MSCPENLNGLYKFMLPMQVKDLVRLSLQDPEYIAVHAEASAPTPLKLQQVRISTAKLHPDGQPPFANDSLLSCKVPGKQKGVAHDGPEPTACQGISCNCKQAQAGARQAQDS